MKFSKVKLAEGGMGLEVWFEKSVNTKFGTTKSENHVKFKAPVHDLLQKKIEAFRSHLATIMFIENESPDEVEITGVKSNGDDNFLIMWKVRTFGGVCGGATPVIGPDSNYPKFREAMECVREVYAEAAVYILEGKTMDSAQLAMKFVADEKTANGKTMEEVKGMGEKELTEFCREVLAKRGAFVMMEDRGESEDEDETSETNEPVLETKEEVSEVSSSDSERAWEDQEGDVQPDPLCYVSPDGGIFVVGTGAGVAVFTDKQQECEQFIVDNTKEGSFAPPAGPVDEITEQTDDFWAQNGAENKEVDTTKGKVLSLNGQSPDIAISPKKKRAQ